jgi:hypothetical protein
MYCKMFNWHLEIQIWNSRIKQRLEAKIFVKLPKVIFKRTKRLENNSPHSKVEKSGVRTEGTKGDQCYKN